MNFHKIPYVAFFLGILTLAISCTNPSKYPGFRKSKNGLHYQLVRFGEKTKKPEPGDFVTADITYSTLGDSAFFSGRRKLQLAEPNFKGSVDHCFFMLAEGDAANFIISADLFFHQTLQSSLPSFLKEGDKIIIGIHLIELQTEEEYLKEKEAFISWIQDFGEYEMIVLRQFLEQAPLNVDPIAEGLYKFIIQQGNQADIEPGDTVSLNYEGKFLNGKFFDSTRKRNQPFQLVYGTEMQLIKGIDQALSTMSEGEKAILVLSSGMAFGSEGSSTGIIPPYTSLIYEIEVLSVKKGKKT